MPIVKQGSLNTTALVVPDFYVQIVPPQVLNLNGVPTNVIGVVGTASWGPLDSPVVFGNSTEYNATFGPIMARKYDMGTQVATAIQQGASSFVGVRVSDGTDVAAVSNATTPTTYTAKYTGTQGNNLTVTLAAGSAANSWMVTVGMPGQAPEMFNNIPGPPTTSPSSSDLNTFWQAVATAINNGTLLRGPSQFVTASFTTAATPPSPAAATYTFSGGTDGASTVTASTLVGTDISPRTGMYALEKQGVSIGVLADADDSTQWSVQAAFGYTIGAYMILASPASQTIAAAVSAKAAAGIDDYSAKIMFGDWIYWNDQTNNVTRLVSPQGFVAGRLANLSPEQSSLNKPLYGIVGSQKSGAPGSTTFNTYSAADLSALLLAGIDVIANPAPGGNYWAVRGGHNSSTDAAIQGDNYTRMTNYIAATLAAGMGIFVGNPINLGLMRSARSTMLTFLKNMLGQNMLALLVDGSLPYSVICDASNNPQSRVSLGYMQADAAVTYQAINEKFIVNMQGGQTVVQPARQATQANG
ncbi:phage tail sheath protein [Acidocella aminolytica]|uniref:Phage tail sheath protein n=1 Tax=Acidocella aminolytica 101 = DSM 11237 TaxID=1120923 RepID=A0A0D6PEJ9_9PROT|nr:tail protein [Acidocella aminolytica]GAN79776.1 phage tail sheath protein [Acidocella aminolytica 101 = DSM 11237]GBQ32020.1 phage tail sheath protein [Acidocella aminolytica 101 = DSM 11237]SHF35782.1 hypothetical protein SAMN02746095_02956 [Acidocella aminolytica 101 = DSM 11237]